MLVAPGYASSGVVISPGGSAGGARRKSSSASLSPPSYKFFDITAEIPDQTAHFDVGEVVAFFTSPYGECLQRYAENPGDVTWGQKLFRHLGFPP